MRLTDTAAVVTGAVQGIGRAVALDMAAEGADLLLADIQGDKVASVAAEVAQAGHVAHSMAVDVTDAVYVEAMVQRALAEFGRIDVLINDAGGSGDEGIREIEDVTEERWDRAVDLNLKGCFLCCSAVIPHMRERGYGSRPPGRLAEFPYCSRSHSNGPPLTRPRQFQNRPQGTGCCKARFLAARVCRPVYSAYAPLIGETLAPYMRRWVVFKPASRRRHPGSRQCPLNAWPTGRQPIAIYRWSVTPAGVLARGRRDLHLEVRRRQLLPSGARLEKEERREPDYADPPRSREGHSV